MNATQLITQLELAEVSSEHAGDTRRMMRDERFALVAAVRSGDAKAIKDATIEAQRVAKMWGVCER